MSENNWPVRSGPEPVAPVFRVEFSAKTRAQLLNWRTQRTVVALGAIAWTGVLAFLVISGRMGQLAAFAGYVPILLVAIFRVRQLSKIPVEAAAVTVSAAGLDLWSPQGDHLVLPWDAVASVRAGQLGVGVRLSPDIGRVPGVVGLSSSTGAGFARRLADPTDSPLLSDQIAYDRGALLAALRRMAPEGRVEQ